jgi:hypothetical protein
VLIGRMVLVVLYARLGSRCYHVIREAFGPLKASKGISERLGFFPFVLASPSSQEFSFDNTRHDAIVEVLGGG